MFYYCPKCANIKKINSKADSSIVCELCKTDMQAVPSEYLMTNGNFFKSQEARQKFITSIQSSDTYDSEIGDNKEELKQAVEAEKQKHIQEMNKKMAQEQFHMTCPICGSHSIQKVSTVGKYTKIGLLGILGADDLGKRWKCKVCGAKF